MISLLVVSQLKPQLRVKLAEGQAVANTITTWGNVTAAGFFLTAGPCAPQKVRQNDHVI